MKRLFYLLLICLISTYSLSVMACNKPKMYKIDFCGQQPYYLQQVPQGHKPEKSKKSNPSIMEGMVSARSEYYAGEQVVLYFYMVATDTNYTFLLDGEKIYPDYQTGKGYIIHFIMPEHDVKLQCISRNSMIREVPPQISSESE